MVVQCLFTLILVLVGAAHSHSSSSTDNTKDQGIFHGKEDVDPLRRYSHYQNVKTRHDLVETILASFDTFDTDNDNDNDNVNSSGSEADLVVVSEKALSSPLPRPGNVKNYRYQYVNEGSIIIRSFGNDSTCTVSSKPTTTLSLNTCQSRSDARGGDGGGASTMFTLLVSQHRKTKATKWTVITSVYDDSNCVQLHHAQIYGQFSSPSTCRLGNADVVGEEYTVIDVVQE